MLIRSALDPDLQRRLRESPDEVFADFNLSAEEQDILRHPDHRLMPLLGAALARQTPESTAAPAPQAQVAVTAKALADVTLALTIVPCRREVNGVLQGFAYAAWVSPLAPGADPSMLPPPAGAALPGPPCPPLHATLSVSAVQVPGADGNPQAAMWAWLRQSSNVTAPPAVEAAANPAASPFGSDMESAAVREAVARVRAAAASDRYAALLSLLRTLRTGDVV